MFSDMTEDYVTPSEPDPYSKVTIRFRGEINVVDRVFLVNRGIRHLMQKERSDEYFDFFYCVIEVKEEEFSYYFAVEAKGESFIYDTRGVVKEIMAEQSRGKNIEAEDTEKPDVEKKDTEAENIKAGNEEEKGAGTENNDEIYQFRIIPGFKTPAWAKGAVMYQIYVDRFCNGDPSNDVLTNEYEYAGGKAVRVTDWNKCPAKVGMREFYGGDLQGVMDKMDYLQDLGIDVIYFNPLFVSPSNHKYDIQDYDYIDPHFGRLISDQGELLRPRQKENRFATRYIDRVTNKVNLEAGNELFAKLVQEAHRRGIRVILDGVFNHCGSFHKWMDREQIYEYAEGYEKGAYVEKESPYHDYFYFHEEGKWPYNGNYDGWWGYDTLPKLNYESSRALFDYIIRIGVKWVSPPYNADGWRLDVAADLGGAPEFNHYFWREFRKAVREANPDAIVLAEHYGSSRDWLNGKEWDSVMNYDAFMEPVTWFLTGMEKHSDEYREDMYGNADDFIGAMKYYMTSFTTPSLQIAMNELSNHDHSRFLTRTNQKVGRIENLGSRAAGKGVNKAVLREAVVIQMTWPGAPTIYYGDEAGVCGFTDPDNRRTYPWKKEDKELIRFHKEMIRIHKACPEILTGSLEYLISEYNIIGYGRFNWKTQTVVVINNNDHEVVKEIPVWPTGIPKDGVSMKRLMLSYADGFTTKEENCPVREGKIRLELLPVSAVVFRYEAG